MSAWRALIPLVGHLNGRHLVRNLQFAEVDQPPDGSHSRVLQQ